MPNYFSDRTNATAGNKNLSLAERNNMSNSFSLLVPLTWREPRGGIESDALGWSSAGELCWAPGMERAHGNQAALQRHSSGQEQLLCKVQQDRGQHLQALRGEEGGREKLKAIGHLKTAENSW